MRAKWKFACLANGVAAMPVTSPEYCLSDEQWGLIEPLLPVNGKRGGQWKDHRVVIDGMLWALSDGGRWRNVPERFGPWQTVYDRFCKWTREGLWDRILESLRAKKEENGEIDFRLFAIDGSVVRAHQSSAGAPKKSLQRASQRTTHWAAAKVVSALNCT
jgi:transposase